MSQLSNYHLWTALITPFNNDLSIDYDSFETLLKQQEEAQNGLLVLGSTGEALNIPLNLKKEIVTYVANRNNKTPLMIGVGGQDIKETKEWINFLESKNIDCYLMVTPIYSKPGKLGQYYWFKELMDLSSRPVMLYNVPSRAGIQLNFDAVKMLTEHKNFWAIKEASGSVDKFNEYKVAAKGRPVYCGDDALMPLFAQNGSHGLVSVASNVWPKETNQYVKESKNQTLKDADLWAKASNSLFLASNPVPAKVILATKNIINNYILYPPLHADDLSLHQLETIKEYDLKIRMLYN